MTIFTNVKTHKGEMVSVITRTTYSFLFFRVPHTTVLPLKAKELGTRGVQFQWKTSDHNTLGQLHELVVHSLREMELDDMRHLADVAKPLVVSGLRFVADDVPVSDFLKRVAPYVRRLV